MSAEADDAEADLLSKETEAGASKGKSSSLFKTLMGLGKIAIFYLVGILFYANDKGAGDGGFEPLNAFYWISISITVCWLLLHCLALYQYWGRSSESPPYHDVFFFLVVCVLSPRSLLADGRVW